MCPQHEIPIFFLPFMTVLLAVPSSPNAIQTYIAAVIVSAWLTFDAPNTHRTSARNPIREQWLSASHSVSHWLPNDMPIY
ncbi:hypothetical protein B0H14DRAFT_1147899 [Mycena olivaceomarginata]|nr:hypothetical protein B0H14DRAFT_1147899 [Mycena olivaceomarginata]